MHAAQVLCTYLQTCLKRVQSVEKTVWLGTAMTPDRAERTFLGVILAVFLPIQAAFVVGEPFCDVGTPS